MKKGISLFIVVLFFFLLSGFGNSTQEKGSIFPIITEAILENQKHTDEDNDSVDTEMQEEKRNISESNIESYNAVKNRYFFCIEKIDELNSGRDILKGDSLADYDLYYSLNYLSVLGILSFSTNNDPLDKLSAITGSREFFGIPDLTFEEIEDLLNDFFSYHSAEPSKEVLRKMIEKYCSIDSISYTIDETEEYSFVDGKVISSPIPLYVFEINEVDVFLNELKLSEEHFAEDLLMLNLYGENVEFDDESHTITFFMPCFQQK